MLSTSQNKATAPVVGAGTPGIKVTSESSQTQPGVGTPAPGATQPSLPIEPAATNASGSTPVTSIEGYPNDIPFLTDNNGDLSKTVSQGMNMYTFTSNMPYDQIVDFFKTGMATNGWTVLSETSQSGQQSWNFMKGENRMVMVALNDQGGSTRVTVMLVSQ
jgi:hypothetical protein